ncbi:MAG: hypothetical protein UY07_C0043G0004 [Parcubacteria group bacterium GW2011_GWA1_47_8]|nr:MAG: hypothetical protein UY07_C0043G0004 [Parcubacteria group bacterium GW2011_GWA1_47_8]
MTTKVLDFSNIERKLFWIFSISLLACILFYMYAMFSLTVSVVERDRLSRATHELAAKVSMVEIEYMERSKTITLAHAQELGFREVTAKFTGNQAATFSMTQ